MSNMSQNFIKAFFLLLSVLFFTAYFLTTAEHGPDTYNLTVGALSGVCFGIVLIALSTVFRRYNLRAFNTALLGLFFGYLMGEGILLIFHTVLDVGALQLHPGTVSIFRIMIFLTTIYLAMNLTARAADELYVSIPFIKFKPTSYKKKDILLDGSILLDPRLIDLASSGLLDQHIVIPRFIVKELNEIIEGSDENTKPKARKSLEVLKKLENIPTLDVRYVDTDFSELKDPTIKLTRLARMLDANIFTADMNRIQQSAHEGLRIINIHALSNALKPITQTGEQINIKVQRYGKEPRQGVGYLEDGTMVVINGGAEYIGETIKAQVLSVKHTSSGRMIFCNAAEEGLMNENDVAQSIAEMENAHKNYFTL